MSFDHPLMTRDHPDLPKYPDQPKPKKPCDTISIKSSNQEIAALRKAHDDYALNLAEYNNKIAAYREAMNKLEEDFWKKLEFYNGVQNAPEAKRSLVRSLAWDYGHSAGYANVVTYYDDLVELIR